jgi:hypothetical protein
VRVPVKISSDELSPVERLHFALRRALQNGRDIEVVENLLIPGRHRQKIDALDPGFPVPLSVDMARVYMKAALARRGDVATRNQIRAAEQALSGLTLAHDRLLDIVPRGSRTLAAALGDLPKNLKGLDELNDLTEVCNEILGHVAEANLKLRSALDREKAKPGRTGERRKRLRSLVETLADWWLSNRGSAPAVIPKSKRSAKRRVHLGYEGPFLDLARALFCELDEFTDDEVVATVKNVIKHTAKQSAAASAVPRSKTGRPAPI